MCRLTGAFVFHASRSVASIRDVPGAFRTRIRTRGARGDDGARAERRGRVHLSDAPGGFGRRVPCARQLGIEGGVVTEAQMRAPFGEGRHPNGIDELGSAYPTYGGRGQKAVAGYDLVFSPVRSASVLWALGGPTIRLDVEDVHHDAVRSTLEWIETHAARSPARRRVWF